jgi:ribonuclease HI
LDINSEKAWPHLLITDKNECVIYTDAAKKGEASVVGVAAYVVTGKNNYTISATLLGHHSVLEGELYAINLAVKAAHSLKLPRAKIFSDSQAALMHLGSSRKLSPTDLKTRESLCKGFSLHWLPSHRNIPGNELADIHAKKAIDRTDTLDIGRDERKVMKNLTREDSLKVWQNQWDNTEDGRATHALIPKIRRERYSDSHAVNRWVSGHISTKDYLYRFNLDDSPLCETCDTHDSITHRLLQCPALTDLRRRHECEEAATVKDLLSNIGFLESACTFIMKHTERD